MMTEEDKMLYKFDLDFMSLNDVINRLKKMKKEHPELKTTRYRDYWTVDLAKSGHVIKPPDGINSENEDRIRKAIGSKNYGYIQEAMWVPLGPAKKKK